MLGTQQKRVRNHIMTTITKEQQVQVVDGKTVLLKGVSYPSEMRRQLWPLCCGASIISGFKDAHKYKDEAEFVKAITDVCSSTPDLQVFAGETINPKLTFLTLNSTQMASEKIMGAIKAAGFVRLGTGAPRGSEQGFFIRDLSGTFKSEVIVKGQAAAVL